MYSTEHPLDLQHLAPVAYSIHGCMDSALEIARRIGLDAVIYDFAPVPTTPEGALMTPSVIEPCNLPAEMRELWVGQGLYQKDPVQALALKRSCPFFWSYHRDEVSVLQSSLDERSAAVSAVLHDWKHSRGVTVPLHMPDNQFATMTGFWHDDSFPLSDAERDLCVMRFAYLAQAANDRLATLFGRHELTPVGVGLSARERECILLAAQGMSTKQIAWKLKRSESTVVLHLQSAARKLGGRNRAQAIARAAHFGYLRDRVM